MTDVVNVEVVQAGYRWNVTTVRGVFSVRRLDDKRARSGEDWLVFNSFGQSLSIFNEWVAGLIQAVRESEKSA